VATADPRRSSRDPLAAFARGELSGWRGLERETTIDDVVAVFAVDREFTGTSPLGATFEPAGWMAAAAEAFPGGIRVWHRGDLVALLDAHAGLGTAADAALLAELGEPEARWDGALGPIPVPGSEWVYARRGLTLYVDPETRRVDRVLAYAPTSVEAYAQRARPHTDVVPLPEQGGANGCEGMS
jgi:hypothetical protein